MICDEVYVLNWTVHSVVMIARRFRTRRFSDIHKRHTCRDTYQGTYKDTCKNTYKDTYEGTYNDTCKDTYKDTYKGTYKDTCKDTYKDTWAFSF